MSTLESGRAASPSAANSDSARAAQLAQALGIEDGSLENGARLVQSEPPAISQLFYALDAGNGAVTFRNVVSGKCLDVEGSSQSNGAPIIQYTCNGKANQQWRLTHIFGD